MDILIIGPSGSGKSKLGDLVRNTIFKLDKEAKILTKDPDRGVEPFGEGKNTYNIEIEQASREHLSAVNVVDLKKDIVIVLTKGSVAKWFTDVYES
jgi:ribose 1,5-bisphosphokinase PhnN